MRQPLRPLPHLLATAGLLLSITALAQQSGTPREPARIFIAQQILTMNPAQPTATAVAVSKGRIVAVGTRSSVIKALGGQPYEVDTTFARSVILPGFVEAHTHFQGYGLFSRLPYLGYVDRPGPDGGTVPGVKSLQGIVDRLKAALAEHVKETGNPSVPLLAFGADPSYFGGQHLNSKLLDQASTQTPILVLLGSGHIVACNTPMLKLIQASPGWKTIAGTPAVVMDPVTNQPTGELDELAAVDVALGAFAKANPKFFTPERTARAIRDAGNLTRRQGITTATDLMFGGSTKAEEEGLRDIYRVITSEPEFPTRVVLGYFAPKLVSNWGNDAVSHLQSVQQKDTDKLRTGPVKITLDGSPQGYTAQLKAPGYWNGQGNPIWNVNPGADLDSLAEPFWKAGFQLAVHVNGDNATEAILEALQRLQQKYPQPDHRLTLEHNQMATREQYERTARLGAAVNLFANHLWYYGEVHYNITLGPERANGINSAATADSLRIPFSLHSDAPVTAAQPLLAAWAAVNRTTRTGGVLGPEHRISVDRALWAITMGGAYLLKLEKEIGSIEVGKRADFAVLEQDPLKVAPAALKDIPIRATVLDGKVFPTSG